MNTSSAIDSRLCGCKTHGGSEGRQLALEARRQAFVRRTLNPDDGLRSRFVPADALSLALLVERDQLGVDYAAGAGY